MALIKLNLQLFSGERTEKATPKKREETKKKGQVAKSVEINTAVILLSMFLFLLFGRQFLFDQFVHVMKEYLQHYLLKDLSTQNAGSLLSGVYMQILKLIGPFLGVAFIAAIVANVSQVGFMFSTESISLKFDRLNPIQGFKKIYSLRAIVELVKSLLKITIVGAATFYVIWQSKQEILNLPYIGIRQVAETIYNLVVKSGLFASCSLLAMAILDLFYQRFDFEKNIRMSKQDIKDEYKKSEGDPHIKAKIKQKQREIAMRRMMQEIPNADVIITNPTHYAVALKYDENKRDAPFVVAKGVDFLALKIREIAKAHDIVTIENRPLARALYAQTEIGDEVPEEFFKAVAEILAYVYKLKRKI
ncbi:flagellar biosynthesis protein FlhB [Gottfriedia luciferensis]|uniref:flagellar biosynthesis protein FlhB n=1 Tax=Gottfriedia luciferensis TaxID=178774 RepID=UPI000B44D332|nr:flagellar biosynthesis protein FlhB [Gottfriedia luciferensis]